MNPTMIDEMGWAMGQVYGSVQDRILVNLAKYFPYLKPGEKVPGAFEYQARMLAKIGQVNRETAQIIVKSLGGADEALRQLLETAIRDSLKDVDPVLKRAAEQGLLNGQGFVPPAIDPGMMNAFKAYYNQSKDKLNLVNTVMLESTEWAYTGVVSDITNQIQRTQEILNANTGEVISGVTSYNQAVRNATRQMVTNGLTGFIDHGGHRWSPEAYAAMDIKTTMMNAGRAAVMERNEQYGNDLYQVSSHAGARPLCYPWQGKVISSSGRSGTTTDLYGNEIVIHSEDEIESFRYGGGLFGVNCGHYPMVFIPNFSTIRDVPQDKQTNDRVYAESQEQRALERKIRQEKLELDTLKAQGADKALIDAQRAKVRSASADIDEFCERTGRHRLREREYTPVKAEYPPTPNIPPRPVTQPVVTEPVATNIFGEQIKFNEKMMQPEYDITRRQVETLASEFKTKLQEVTFGSKNSAGSVDISGSTMRLTAPKKIDVVTHEFAHTISIPEQTKYGLYDEKPFWDEIRKIRTQYRKATRDNPANWISSYADSENKIEEFMAEGFTLGYFREKGLEIPSQYGNDTVFSKMVLDSVRKYFGR